MAQNSFTIFARERALVCVYRVCMMVRLHNDHNDQREINKINISFFSFNFFTRTVP